MAIWAIAISKGGTGKTTSTVHIAGELNPDQILDQDVGNGISIINQLRPEDKRFNVSRFNDKNSLLKELKESQERGETVLVDCGGFDSDITQAVIAVADIILVPANDSLTERLGIMGFEATLESISKAVNRDIQVHLFTCKASPLRKHFPRLEEVISHTKHFQLLDTPLSSRTDFTESIESGLGITETISGRSTQAGKEVRALVERAKNILKDTL